VQFTDANYPDESTLNYTLTIYFPTGDPRNPWAAFTGSVTNGSGTVVASHATFGTTDEELAAAQEPKADGSKNKGCLAFLAMLPF
jgi:hypothetical protein